MIPRDKLERLPIPVPGLEEYVVDSEGQVWRKGGKRGLRPLKGMGFTDAVRAWEVRGGILHPGDPQEAGAVFVEFPGVWRFTIASEPGAKRSNLHQQRDFVGFMMRYVTPHSIERGHASPPTQPRNTAWFAIRSPANPSRRFLIAGVWAFDAIKQKHR